MNNKQTYRHGDLFFTPVDKLEGSEVKHNGSFVLAEGETTGHKHLLTADRMTIRKTEDGRFYLSLETPGTITHEEHKTIVLPPGIYEMGNEREKDWFSGAVRQVID